MNAATLYDHPLYYDILFGWDRSSEAAFYHRLFERAGVAPQEGVLEVACGTAQVGRRLARLGRNVCGLDSSAAMLAFLRERAADDGVALATICADMRSFVARERYGAAFNPMSSFRLLHGAQDAEAHLRAMAAALRSGGIYALDMHFAARLNEPELTTDEEWVMTRGAVTVRATDDAIEVDDAGRRITLRWGNEAHLGTQTCEYFAERVAAVPELCIEAWHPETARSGADGVSTFDADAPVRSPCVGRTMVVLRRV